MYIYIYVCVCVCVCGQGSTVGIATGYRLDGPGIEFLSLLRGVVA